MESFTGRMKCRNHGLCPAKSQSTGRTVPRKQVMVKSLQKGFQPYIEPAPTEARFSWKTQRQLCKIFTGICRPCASVKLWDEGVSLILSDPALISPTSTYTLTWVAAILFIYELILFRVWKKLFCPQGDFLIGSGVRKADFRTPKIPTKLFPLLSCLLCIT